MIVSETLIHPEASVAFFLRSVREPVALVKVLKADKALEELFASRFELAAPGRCSSSPRYWGVECYTGTTLRLPHSHLGKLVGNPQSGVLIYVRACLPFHQ